MEITPMAIGVTLVLASLLVSGMIIHYVSVTRRRHDPLLIYGMLAGSFVLLAAAVGIRAGRTLITQTDLFPLIAFSFAAFCFSLVIWREGLRRFRNAD